MLSRPSLDLVPGRAPEGLYKKPMSFDTVIKSRRKIRIDTPSGTSWGTNASDRIDFQFGSNNNAVDFFASYMCFEFTTTGKYDGSAVDYRRYLASGGIHSLFDRITVSTIPGVPIEMKNHYAHNAAFFSKLYQSPELLDDALFPEGNSLGIECHNLPQLGLNGYSYKCTGTVTGGTIVQDVPDATDLVLTGSATAAFDTELAVGDEIIVRVAATGAITYQGIVSVVTSATSISVTPRPVATIAAGSILFRKPVANRVLMTGSQSTSQTGVKVYFKPFLSLFMMDSYFPIWLTDGLAISFELNPANKVVVLSNRYALSADASVSYTISKPRFYIQTIEYDDVTKASWEQQWRSGEGILFHSRRYDTWQKYGLSNSTAALNVQINVEALSAKAIYAFIQSPLETTRAATATRTTATQVVDPHARYYDANILQYQYRQGSNLYPPAPVIVGATSVDVPMVEAWAELLEAMGVMYMQHRTSIPHGLWWKQNHGLDTASYTTDAPANSHRSIFAVNLSNYDGPFGGVFTRNNRFFYLDLQPTGTAWSYAGNGSGGNSRELMVIVERDAILQIQADIGITVYS